MPQETKVAIAVVTYRRPAELGRLLDSLGQLNLDCQLKARVIVVDNDPNCSAMSVVGDARSHLPFDLIYVVEETKGIAAARNRAVAAVDDGELIAFIDDDETADPDWLEALVREYSREPCAAVSGPVIPRYRGGQPLPRRFEVFFAPRILASGTHIAAAETNNILLDPAICRSYGISEFDLRFGLTGGSDSMFSRSLALRGAQMRWTNDARVYEDIGNERLNLRWTLSRALRNANTSARIDLLLQPNKFSRLRCRARLCFGALARLAAGLVALVASIFQPAHAPAALRRMARGCGYFVGALDLVYVEYSRDGRRLTRRRPLDA